MKIKMLIAMAITGLFAASIAAAVPAGDDLSPQNMQETATTSGNVGAMSGMDSNNDASANDNASAPTDANSDMSADTATGDDDY